MSSNSRGFIGSGCPQTLTESFVLNCNLSMGDPHVSYPEAPSQLRPPGASPPGLLSPRGRGTPRAAVAPGPLLAKAVNDAGPRARAPRCPQVRSQPPMKDQVWDGTREPRPHSAFRYLPASPPATAGAGLGGLRCSVDASLPGGPGAAQRRCPWSPVSPPLLTHPELLPAP